MSVISQYLLEDNIFTNQTFSNKQDLLKTAADHLFKKGVISSKEQFLKDVDARESEGTTALGDGIAMPHCKSSTVSKTTMMAFTLSTPLQEWSADATDPVSLVFLIAARKDAADLHIDILKELGDKLSFPALIKELNSSSDGKSFLKKFSQEQASQSVNMSTGPIILAVTACPAGMAHTYMAASKLKAAAAEMGISLVVETQGAAGSDSDITSDMLERASAVIFATEVAIKNQERFSHLPSIDVGVAEAIKNPGKLLEQALKLKSTGKTFDKSSVNSTGPSKGEEVKRALMTGISHAVPLIVGGAMTLAVAVLISQAFGLQTLYNTENSWLWLYRRLGGNILGQLMVPVISAYISFYLAEKAGLGPGFAAGVAANMIGSGFLGGMAGGFIAGYLMRLIKKIRLGNTLDGFLTFYLYPVLGTLGAGSIMLFIVGPPVATMNVGLTNWLNGLSGSNAILLGAVIGGFVSFDMGGPVNKAAYAFCLGALSNGNYTPYAVFASVKMVSAFATTFATMFRPSLFKDFEIESGKATWILGLAGITEGAIPVMMEDPIRVITSYVAGSAVAGAIVAYYNVGLQVPGAGIFSLFLLEPNTSGTLMAASVWFFAAVLGALISTALLIVWKSAAQKKLG